MKAILSFAGLTVLTAVLSVWSTRPVAAELWFIVSIGTTAMCGALLLALLMDAPPIQWRPNRPRFALSIVVILAMIPVGAVVAGLSLVLALPAILFALIYLPPMLWREHHIEHHIQQLSGLDPRAQHRHA